MIKSWFRLTLVALTLSLAFWAGSATGQELGSVDLTLSAPVDQQIRESLSWGTGNPITHTVKPFDFNGWGSSEYAKIEGYGPSLFCSQGCYLITGVNLPQGVIVTAIEIDAYDATINGQVQCFFLTTPLQTDGYNGVGVGTGLLFNGGDILPNSSLTIPAIDNFNYNYSAYCDLTTGGSDLRLRGFRIFYELQISPAPAVATFPDVSPSFWAFQEIEALAASGITQGYPDGTFKPTNPVTRAQMATFLARALGLHWPG